MQAFRALARRNRADVQPVVGRAAATRSRCGRTSPISCAKTAVDSGAADDRPARQRAGCGRADHRAAQRGRSDSRAAAGRDRRRAREGDHPSDGAARAEAGRAGAVHRRGAGARRRTAATCRRTCRFCRATASAGCSQRRPAARCITSSAAYPAVTGRDLRNARPSLDENNRPAVELLAEQRRRDASSATSPRPTSTAQLAIVLDNRVYSAPQHQQPHRRRRASSRAASPIRKRRTCRWCCGRVRCRANLTYLEERTVGPIARR